MRSKSCSADEADLKLREPRPRGSPRGRLSSSPGAYVFAPYDCKKDGKGSSLLDLSAQRSCGTTGDPETVAQLGELDERGRVEARALARRLIGAPDEAPLFNDGSEYLTASVRLKGVRVERSRRFGDVYVALALWRGLRLEELCRRLLPMSQERIGWAKMAAVLVTARFCEPSSELHIAEDWYRRTALAVRCSSAMRRSTRIGSIVRSIACSRTRRPWRRTCPSVADSCSQSTTTCCSTTSPAPISRARRRRTRRRSAAIPAIIAPTARRCASRWW